MFKKSSVSLLIIMAMMLSLTFLKEANAANTELIWHFDEGNGDVCKEANGTGNDAVFTGVDKKNIKWDEGIYGGALLFSGKLDKGQWVEVPHSADVDIRDAITMEAWVYPLSPPLTKGTVITKLAYYMQVESTLQVATYFYALNNEGYHLSDGEVKLKEWSHIAVTYDGKKIKFYINGELDDNVVGAEGQIRSNAGAGVHIGGEQPGCCPRYFPGRLDEVKISNYAKTPAQLIESIGTQSVTPRAKIATSWAYIKTGVH